MKKSEVSEFLTMLTKKYRASSKISDIDTELVLELLSHSEKFSNIADNADSYYLKIDTYKIASGRKIKMLWACTKQYGYCLPLPKNRIINSIFQNKEKKKNRDADHFKTVKQAARNIISSQISEYRESLSLPISCPISKKLLTNWSNIHIDHVKPFSLLFDEWLEINNLNPFEIKLKGPANLKTFADPGLVKSWFDFHLSNAELNAVHSTANLSKGSKYEPLN